MGSTGGGHDSKTAHGGTDHRRAQGCSKRALGPRAPPKARHLGGRLLEMAYQACEVGSPRREEAAPAGRRKRAVETWWRSKRRYGCPRNYVRLRREGWFVNHQAAGSGTAATGAVLGLFRPRTRGITSQGAG